MSHQTQSDQQTTWSIDPSHSSVNFSIKHMMIAKVNGTFSKFKGELKFNRGDISQSAVSAEIEVASIDTKDEKRNAHLMSADFFDVEKFPLITFRSKKVEKDGDDHRVYGDLTIHGVTKEVALAVEGLDSEVKDPWGNMRMGATAKTKIKRKDFELSWNTALEAGGVLVGDDVAIELDIQFVKQ